MRRAWYRIAGYFNYWNWRNTRHESGLMDVDQFIESCLADDSLSWG